jgi:hypothetical protein
VYRRERSSSRPEDGFVATARLFCDGNNEIIVANLESVAVVKLNALPMKSEILLIYKSTIRTGVLKIVTPILVSYESMRPRNSSCGIR